MADFLKVTSVLGRRVERVNHRMMRPVPERVLRFAANFDDVSRTGLDPMDLSAVFDKYFDVATNSGEDKSEYTLSPKILGVIEAGRLTNRSGGLAGTLANGCSEKHSIPYVLNYRRFYFLNDTRSSVSK